MKINRGIILAASALILGSLTGCIGAGGIGAMPSHYYRLDLPASVESVVAKDPSTSKILLRVQVTEALKSPKIVTARNNFELNFLDIHRWGEPLSRGVSRLLVAQLRPYFVAVEATPILSGYNADYRVDLVIEKLWGLPAGEIVMEARWSICDSHEKPLKSGRYSAIQKGWNTGDFRDYSERVSKMMPGLAQAILDTLSPLDAARKNP